MKYYGKEKCRILKEIRAEIARQNDIEWVTSECRHQGNCKGTCPKCEQEVRELERALARREAVGKTVAVIGISASLTLAVTGCELLPIATTTGEPLGGQYVMETETPVESSPVTEMTEMGEMLPPDSVSDTSEVPYPGEVPVMGDPVDCWDELDTDDESEESEHESVCESNGETDTDAESKAETESTEADTDLDRDC